MGRGKSEDMNTPVEGSFARSARMRAEHAAEAKRATPAKSKDTFVPTKGGNTKVDKAVWDATK